MPQKVHETAVITEAAAAAAKKTGRMLVQFISPGWGSSGYYSSEVLEQAVTDQVIPAGTHMYADHPTDAEDIERPVRSIKDLMAVTDGPSRLATEADAAAWGAEPGAVVGEVQVVPQWRDLVETVKDSIGTSIRGSATDIVEGEAEGRRGGIIEGLVAPVLSVDFVTRAGRGGRVLSVLESAAANRRAIGHGISEATVNDTREALQTALRDAYGAGERTYVWVRDFDDSTVWFEVDSEGDSGLWGQSYTQADSGAVTLTGDRSEVRIVTKYVPVNPAGQSITTEESEEDTMPNIEESELARLREDAGRVQALEAERDTERQGREAAERQRDELRAREAATGRARTRVTEANADLAPATVERIVAEATRTVPLTDAGQLDETALDAAVDSARTAEESYLAGLAQASGAGTVSGFGGTPTPGDQEVSEADIDNVVAGAFGRTVKEA